MLHHHMALEGTILYSTDVSVKIHAILQKDLTKFSQQTRRESKSEEFMMNGARLTHEERLGLRPHRSVWTAAAAAIHESRGFPLVMHFQKVVFPFRSEQL